MWRQAQKCAIVDFMLQLKIDVRSLVKRIDKSLTALQRDQLPFATALALTHTAQTVQKIEKQNLKEVFPTATPFTERGIGIQKATKNNLDAIVYIKDIQAAYLEPYEFGGKSIPAKPSFRAMLTPKAIGVNAYGNIPYQKIKTLLGSDLDNPDVAKTLSASKIARLKKNQAKYFIGVVKTKSGTVSGLWERTNAKIASAVHYSTRKQGFSKSGGLKQKGLRLLVRFTDPRQVTQHLNYYELAKKVIPNLVAKNFSLELKKAMRYAMATAN